MPSRLKTKEKIPIDELSLDGGDWVKVRRWLTAEDRDEINATLTSIKGTTASIDRTKISRATAVQAMVEWGGPGLCVEDHEDEVPEGHTCTAVEITFESVSLLHDADLNKIVTHVTQHNPQAVGPGPLDRLAMPAGIT